MATYLLFWQEALTSTIGTHRTFSALGEYFENTAVQKNKFLNLKGIR